MMYEKLKKQNGEKFAQTVRNFHNGLLEIPDLDIILRHAGRNAEPLLPYLMILMPSNDDIPVPAPVPEDPFVLLDQAGYNAFHADTLEKQNSIKHYFAPGELLCTFNDNARYERYHIIHAVRKDADQINRHDFKGNEQREDEYGTSVISIQMLKEGNFISIKNRYNHAVSYCDHTFNSNPDNIIDGLSVALKNHFNVDFSAPKLPLPVGFVLMGNRILKYHSEHRNVYYGHDVWAEDGVIHAVDKSAGDALFERFLYENKTKSLKKIGDFIDSFSDDFNRAYGGNTALRVENGNLTLKGEILIGSEESQIKTINLPALTAMGACCLSKTISLTYFKASALKTMRANSLRDANTLTHFEAPVLTTMDYSCLQKADALAHFEAPALKTMGEYCLHNANALTQFKAPALTTMKNDCLSKANSLTHFEVPALKTMGNQCLKYADALIDFKALSLKVMGESCLYSVDSLTCFRVPVLATMTYGSLRFAPALTYFEVPGFKSVNNIYTP